MTANRLVGAAIILICSASVLLGQVVVPQRLRVSEKVMLGMLIKKVDPQAPSGDAAHIRGEVVFKAVIGTDGSIENLQTVSGHPMLIGPAIEAVKQWKYKPYLLNGEPVEVETAIRVNFPAGDGSAEKPPPAKEK